MDNVDEAISLAEHFCQVGRCEDASRVYERLLVGQPNLAEIWHKLGGVSHRLGKIDVAIEQTRRALRIKPTFVGALNDLGTLLQSQARFEEALHCFTQALQLEPTNAAISFNLGNLFAVQANYQQAITHYSNAIQVAPQFAVAHYNLAASYNSLGRTNESITHYRRAIELDSQFAAAHCNLADVLFTEGHEAEALEHYRRAIQIDPSNSISHNNLGNALQRMGRLNEAIESYTRAIERNPNYAQAVTNLGTAFRLQSRFFEAMRCHQHALELDPNLASAHHNLGTSFHVEKKSDAAISCYRRALELVPNYAEAHCHLGAELQYQGRLDEAVVSYRRAISLNPKYAEAFSNLGTALVEQGQLGEAKQCNQQALNLEPELVSARWNRAHLRLIEGDFEGGWKDYELRWNICQTLVRNFSQPKWNGQFLPGKSILIYLEQGFGDTFQFIRYIPLVKERVPRVILECTQTLYPFLKDYPHVDRVVTEGSEHPRFDVQSPLLSIPGLLNSNIDTIPKTVPYLSAKEALVKSWQERLVGETGYRIGVNWHGREGQGPFRHRDVPFEQFKRLARVPGVRLINLQKGGHEEIATLGGDAIIRQLGDVDTVNGAFMDTAAIMKNLDLVITSDTAIAHLAGGLGIPVWVALSVASDWRWLLNRCDSPWYPTMRLFRQRSAGDWTTVFMAIEHELRQAVVKAAL